MARLDARLLAARTEVVVEVEKAARDVVATEAVEGDLGISGLEGDSEHDGDDEGAVGGDGGGPAKDGSGLLGGEEDADGPEGGSVHETGGKEEVEEEEDEPAVVLLGVLKILGLLDECSLGEGGDGAPDDGDHGSLGAAVLVGHNASDGADEGSNEGAEPGDGGSVGGIGVDDLVASLPGSSAGVLGDILVLKGSVIGEAAIPRDVSEEVDDELGEGSGISDEGTEAHDVEPSHDVVVLPLEDDDLLSDALLCGLGSNKPQKEVLSKGRKEDEKELVHDLTAGRIGDGGIAGADQGDDTDEGRNETDALHPHEVEDGHAIILSSVVGLVGHEEVGQDCRGGAEREPEPASICGPA